MLDASEKLPGITQFQIKGQTAIITGGSKGLGLAMAAGLASAGANLLLVSRHLDECEASAKYLEKDFGVKAIGFQADVTDSSQTEAMAAYAMKHFNRLDILVNSAGINMQNQ